MPYDEKTLDRVRAILAARRDVTEKRMIGGLCFLVNGNMCCGVIGKDLLVRVGAEARDHVLQELRVHPMKFAGRQLAAFVRVEPEGFSTKAALVKWVRRGADFAETFTTAGPRMRRTKPSKR
jgi:TfoX/Sxy family transcriptional regulator of competence genes